MLIADGPLKCRRVKSERMASGLIPAELPRSASLDSQAFAIETARVQLADREFRLRRRILDQQYPDGRLRGVSGRSTARCRGRLAIGRTP